MTSSKQAYDYIVAMIEVADNYFSFRCIDLAITEFSRCFTEKGSKSELIDLRCDRWREVFQKPNIQIKNQENEPR